jgi:hypothetical protein
MPTISEIRQKYPQYQDLSDEQLAQGLHRKYYSDMPFEDFSSRIGMRVATSPPVAPKRSPAATEHLVDAVDVIRRHPFTAGVGIMENALSGVTGGVGSLLDAVTLSDPGTYDTAYRPRTQAGQRIADLTADEGAKVGQVYDSVFGTGPLATTLKERIPQAAGAVGTVTGAAALRGLRPAPRPLLTAEDVVSRMGAQQSTSAASAAPALGNISPDLRQAIVATGRRVGAVNPDVLQRHIDADTLPVRVRLTEGQATQDPVVISNEMNQRGRTASLSQRFDEQNKQLAENIRVIRDEVGPDVFSANIVEHGDTLIDAYRAFDADRSAQITAAYDALRQAAGGGFPIGAKTLLDNASRELRKQLIFDHAPKSIMNALEGFAAKPGSMTFENFEAMRTNLATIQRTATDGLERRAAGIIRQAMEDLPLVPGAAKLKPLADNARRLARERFQAIEADPAYKAAIEGSVPPDRFVQKFVLGGTRDDLARMAATIPDAKQTMGVAALDYLREQARLNPHYEGNFASASYNKALQRLSPKLRHLVEPRVAEQLEQLGRVAQYTTSQPRGSFVNNSNTYVAATADVAASAAEGAANFAANGIPIGTWARRMARSARDRRAGRRATAPGAGLDALAAARADEIVNRGR